jgi:hypothetical protein
MVANMKMTVFWDVVPCSLTEIDQQFGQSISMRLQGATSQKKVIFKTPKKSTEISCNSILKNNVANYRTAQHELQYDEHACRFALN